jgi:hypothetical protein
VKLEFWAVSEGARTIRIYGKGDSISLAVGSAVNTLQRLHPANTRTQRRILGNLTSTLPRVYWEARAEYTHKDIVDLTTEGGSIVY